LKIPVLQKTDVIVVVPAFNEAASIRQVLIDIRSSGFDALVVDDGSTDSTAFIARECGARVVSLPLNAGVFLQSSSATPMASIFLNTSPT
jgi:glycosyltransferase involved in cell wall biosynthesis